MEHELRAGPASGLDVFAHRGGRCAYGRVVAGPTSTSGEHFFTFTLGEESQESSAPDCPMRTSNLAIVFTDIVGYAHRLHPQTYEQSQRMPRLPQALGLPVFR